MEPLYEAIQHLPPHFDGYFGYRVYKEYVEYVDIDDWAGDGKTRNWTHQEFYDEFKNPETYLEKGVIEFLVTNKLVSKIQNRYK